MTVDVTEDMILQDLGDLLVDVVGAVPVVQGQVNRVPAPDAPAYVVYWPTARRRLSSNTKVYDRSGLAARHQQATEITVQIDVHGEGSADLSQAISTLFRDTYACDFLAARPAHAQPLYNDEPRQVAFITEGDQYEDRWVIMAVLQANPVATTVQQFADALEVGLRKVDTGLDNMALSTASFLAVTPSVIAAGGSAVDMNGLVLTHSTRVPVGQAMTFQTAASVGAFFGLSSAEYAYAQSYFKGDDNSSAKPGAILFAQYPSAPVAGYLRGGPVAAYTLAQLQALTGAVTVVADGVSVTSSAINLSSASSFSAAAAAISTALAGPVVSYDAQTGAFVVTSATTGANSSVSFATGSLASALKLTQAQGAVVSAGAVAGVPGVVMSTIYAGAQNFGTFATLFAPTDADALLFADWEAAQNNQLAYVAWTASGAAGASGDTTSLGALIAANSVGGVIPVYAPVNGPLAAAFVQGFVASLNFSAREGRRTLAFRSQSGLAPDVTDQLTASNLKYNATGYNYYGSYDLANDRFSFMREGSISGPYGWVDSYVNQIWLNNNLRFLILTLLTAVGSIPYNEDGYTMIKAALKPAITAALNFGAIRAGVTLSDLQAVAVNNDAGLEIASTLGQVGWYLQVKDPGPGARPSRSSPNCTLWYMDGESIQAIDLASVQIQ